tara:strand:+ start:367 stop:906 length:540 start_codon:yes stop_codon:yes gene_type:complete
MVKLEIERRFLLGNLPTNLGEGILIEQVYLPLNHLKIKENLLFYEDKKITKINEKKELQDIINSNKKNIACRIRRYKNQYIFTIKIREAPGVRKEWEWEVEGDFTKFFNREYPKVSKTRYELLHENEIWEIDVFLGNNSGLIIAEVELTSLESELNLPIWATNEITGDINYLNTTLANN